MQPIADRSRTTGPALEKWYQFLRWLTPTLEKFSRSHKFTLGERIYNTALNVLDGLIEATYSRNGIPMLLQVKADIYRYFPAIDHAILKTDLRRRIACPQTLWLLAQWQERIAQFLAMRRLSLHPRKTWIAPTTQPAEFLGLELHANGLRRLPESSVRRFRNRLRSLRDQWRAETESTLSFCAVFLLGARTPSMPIHGVYAMPSFAAGGLTRCGSLTAHLLSVCCAAVPGTTTPETPAPPTATTIHPITATTTTVFV